MLQQHVNPNEDLYNLLLVAGILSVRYSKPIIFFPPESEGIDISPGLQTSVMVSKVTFERLSPPYKDRCRNYHKDESHGPATRHLDCFFDCLQDLSLRLCNCTDPSMKLREGFEICSLESDAHVCCLDDVLGGVKNRTLKCDCPLSCRKSTFDMTLSSSMLLNKQDESEFTEPSQETVQSNSGSRRVSESTCFGICLCLC
ncbi:degenerin mec-4-like [Tachypleus tridentatus]|uniref:degenerin mec-4-like n=1 Tax=Tachypleus tridentatus TaxID=6853 RepID=UPI003FD52270